MKASEIIAASPELKTCLVTRLGGFHLIISYMGAIGYIMGGNGLDVLWQTVYADATVQHMLNGHAYARALRAHFLTSAALTTLLLSQPHCLDDVDTNQLRQKLSSLIDKDGDVNDIQVDLLVKDLVDVIERASVDVAAFRTGKLWINYIRQITILKLFIHAERSGDWDLHLYAISQMIPYLHAAGHTQYAKSARLYHQTMKTVQSVMSEDDYARFTTHGYFTIRRTHHFWSGNFTDQTIEQDLMRMLKSAGGMTHGRKITQSTLTSWVHSFPFTIPICKSIEQFISVNCTSSYQHRDHETFYMWLSAHSPFVYTSESDVCQNSKLRQCVWGRLHRSQCHDKWKFFWCKTEAQWQSEDYRQYGQHCYDPKWTRDHQPSRSVQPHYMYTAGQFRDGGILVVRVGSTATIAFPGWAHEKISEECIRPASSI